MSATSALTSSKTDSNQGPITSQTRKKSKHFHSSTHAHQSLRDEPIIKHHRHHSRFESPSSRRQKSRSPSPHLNSPQLASHDSLHPEVSQVPSATTDSDDPISVREPEALPDPLESLPKEYSPDYTLAFKLDEQPRDELRSRLSKLVDRFAGKNVFIYAL